MRSNKVKLSIAVFGVLMLVLAGILFLVAQWHQLREFRDFSDCQAKLRLLGDAMTSYRDAKKGVYPGATVLSPVVPPHRRLSWLVEIFDSYGMAGISLAVDKNKPWNAAENLPLKARIRETEACCGNESHKIITTKNFTFCVCPSSRNVNAPGFPNATSYAGISGFGKDAAYFSAIDPRIGVFGYDRCSRIDDIKDGLSATMAITEASVRGSWTAGDASTLRGVDSTRHPYIGTSGQFGGYHPNGAMSLYADGSVHFIKDSINPAVFEALSTIAGGEKIDPISGSGH